MKTFGQFTEDLNYIEEYVDWGFLAPDGKVITGMMVKGVRKHDELAKTMGYKSGLNAIRNGCVRYCITNKYETNLELVIAPKPIGNAIKFLNSHPKAVGSVIVDGYAKQGLGISLAVDNEIFDSPKQAIRYLQGLKTKPQPLPLAASYIPEVFDSPSPYKWTNKYNPKDENLGGWSGEFRVNDIRYLLSILETKKGEWEIDFGPSAEFMNKMGLDGTRFDIMNLNMGVEFKVYATALAMMKEFMTTVKPGTLYFTAKEASRKKLYARLVKSLKIPGYSSSSDTDGKGRQVSKYTRTVV